jgi:hypothetical protein
MLSNLAMVAFDLRVAEIANRHGLVYTRYADDIVLSARDKGFSRAGAASAVREVYGQMADFGLSPNIAKTRVVPPRGRKVVLGLGVDRERPHVPRKLRDRVRQHLYYLLHPSIGPALHAQNRKFSTVGGLRDHVAGLIAFVGQVDKELGDRFRAEFSKISWPV